MRRPLLRLWRRRHPDRGWQHLPFGVLLALAYRFPIRPILKHGPKSLTCVRVNKQVDP